MRWQRRRLECPAPRLCILVLLALWASACAQSCAESNFELSKESRLPRWFTLPDGLSRSDVSARLDIYANGSFKVRMIGPAGETLAEVNIPIEDRVRIDQWEIRGYKTGNPPEDQNPSYSLTTTNGIQEVIELPGRAMFRVVADPAVLNRLEPFFAAKKRQSENQ